MIYEITAFFSSRNGVPFEVMEPYLCFFIFCFFCPLVNCFTIISMLDAKNV